MVGRATVVVVGGGTDGTVAAIAGAGAGVRAGVDASEATWCVGRDEGGAKVGAGRVNSTTAPVLFPARIRRMVVVGAGSASSTMVGPGVGGSPPNRRAEGRSTTTPAAAAIHTGFDVAARNAQ